MSLIEPPDERQQERPRAGIPPSVMGVGMGGMGQTSITRLDSASSRVAAPRARRSVTLDLERLRRIGYLVPANSRSELSEEFRQIKRPVVRQARSPEAVARRASLVLVTSALAGEGKTFTAINLALSLAMEIDTSVLLVDADVVRSALPRRLGFTAEQGLLDLLSEPGATLEDLVLDTNVPKLSLLPCGTGTACATELLASDAMGALLIALARRSPQQIVVFDGPPLLTSSEARVLATRVGQVLLVVAASTTPRSAVGAALAELAPCPLVMAMFNKAAQPDVAAGEGQA